jgi:hypothetical protein
MFHVLARKVFQFTHKTALQRYELARVFLQVDAKVCETNACSDFKMLIIDQARTIGARYQARSQLLPMGVLSDTNITKWGVLS